MSVGIVERPARSLFEAVVDRYVAVIGWPTSRKTALVSGLTAVSMVPILGLTRFLTPRLGVVDASRLVPFAATAAAVTVGICALSLAVARAGRVGSWIAYLYALAMVPVYHWLFHL